MRLIKALTRMIGDHNDTMRTLREFAAGMAGQSEMINRKLDELIARLPPPQRRDVFAPSVKQQAEGEPPIVDFATTSIDHILDLYFINGCVLLRNFSPQYKLEQLRTFTDTLYAETGEANNIFSTTLQERMLPAFHDFLFTEKHHELLSEIFGGEYSVSPETGTRRIDPGGNDGSWQQPLGPHLDAFYHEFAFTVNFWLPFQDCGIDTPSLGAVRARFDDIVDFTGYDGGPQPERGPELPGGRQSWNFHRFHPAMYTIATTAAPGVELLSPHFETRVWTPKFSLGDAMMLSNWTLHFTHAAPGMNKRRANVELRFRSGSTLNEIVSRRAARTVLSGTTTGASAD